MGRPRESKSNNTSSQARPATKSEPNRYSSPKKISSKSSETPSKKQAPSTNAASPEDDEVPPPSGCFGCFGGKPKPKPAQKSQTRPPSALERPANATSKNKRVEVQVPPNPSSIVTKDSPSKNPPKKVVVVQSENVMESKVAVSTKPPVRDPDEQNSNMKPIKKSSPKEITSAAGNNSPASYKHESEIDSYTSGILPSTGSGSDIRRSLSRPIGRVSGSTMPDVSSATSANNAAATSGFGESNKMYDVCGIRFDRSQFSGAGDSVANFGDLHLAKLEESCRQLIQKVHPPDAKHRLSRSGSWNISASTNLSSSPSASTILSASMSQTLPTQVSFSSVSVNGLNFPAVPAVPSAKFVEISITLTEVLQLQCRPKEAVAVLSRAIDEVNTDMASMRARKQAISGPYGGKVTRVHGNNTCDIDYDDGESEANVKNELITFDGTLKTGSKVKVSSGRVPPTAEEWEQLRKLKAACHRRIGSLYVSLGKYKEAEDHVLKYISYLEKLPESIAHTNEIAYTCSVLACIYDQLGRSDEASTMDFRAIEEATAARKAEF